MYCTNIIKYYMIYLHNKYQGGIMACKSKTPKPKK